MGVPLVKESRVLCNFDGTLDQVSTIAHELGHAFHNECAYRAGKTELQQDTPMTLAETASITCETSSWRPSSSRRPTRRNSSPSSRRA
jgi:oligoendopeptidase F